MSSKNTSLNKDWHRGSESSSAANDVVKQAKKLKQIYNWFYSYLYHERTKFIFYARGHVYNSETVTFYPRFTIMMTLIAWQDKGATGINCTIPCRVSGISWTITLPTPPKIIGDTVMVAADYFCLLWIEDDALSWGIWASPCISGGKESRNPLTAVNRISSRKSGARDATELALSISSALDGSAGSSSQRCICSCYWAIKSWSMY